MSVERIDPIFGHCFERIAAIYTEDARNIAGLMRENPCVVLTGLFGSGKTTFLLPQVTAELTSQGVQAFNIHMFREEAAKRNVAEAVQQAMTVATGPAAVILDEAGLPKPEEAADLVVQAYTQGFSLLAVLPYTKREEDKLPQGIAVWQNSAATVGVHDVPVYDLPLKELDPDLAADVLTMNQTSPEVIAFIIANIPLHLRSLDVLIGARSPRAVAQKWNDQHHRLLTILPYERYEEIREHLWRQVQVNE